MNTKSYQDKIKEQLLVNRYQLINLIGSGAMGKVYMATDKANKGLKVAIKILARSLDDMKTIERFQKEATISALLSERSPYIVKVKDYGVDENTVPFYVMELLEGESLGDFLEYHRLPILKFIELIRQICLAMDTAHNGIFFEGEICPIIHKDIKPSNIFVIEDLEKDELVIKVLDFGIAELMNKQNQNKDTFAGTPKYCSPEQIKGQEIDNRSDIYSLGLVAYEMLEKRIPWDIEDTSIGGFYKVHTEMNPEPFTPESKAPTELQDLIMRCLAKSPHERPQSVGEMIQILDKIKRSLQPLSSLKSHLDTFTSEADSHQLIDNTKQLSPLEQYYVNTPWPKNKPMEKIVFPRLTPIEKEVFPSLWTMLEEKDIENRKTNIRYNKFSFQSYPHPMILWLTVLYSLEDGPRWLPCYLDLKSKIGFEVTHTLSEARKYYIILFPLKKPDKCQEIIEMKVMLKQRTQLKQWLSVSKMLNLQGQNEADASKRRLKRDFEDSKSDIILDIQKNNTQEIYG